MPWWRRVIAVSALLVGCAVVLVGAVVGFLMLVE